MATLQNVLKIHEETCLNARKIIAKKGKDYNRKQQKDGDTLFNMSVARLLGIVESDSQGILVRLSDKFMRLSSLCADPSQIEAVKDESVDDTIEDSINYLVYLKIKRKEDRARMAKKIKV